VALMATHSAELKPHPTSSCEAVDRLVAVVEASVPPDGLQFRYQIHGDVDRLQLPAPGAARRCEGLWQHSCFEAFVRADAGDSYYEFNFAPSTEWAAYRFGGRRADRSAPELQEPAIVFRRQAGGCELSATIRIAELADVAGTTGLEIGLAAVMEAVDGTLSYWSLAHRGDQPDFHDPTTFLMRVATR
jgi:hypothetical protein